MPVAMAAARAKANSAQVSMTHTAANNKQTVLSNARVDGYVNKVTGIPEIIVKSAILVEDRGIVELAISRYVSSLTVFSLVLEYARFRVWTPFLVNGNCGD